MTAAGPCPEYAGSGFHLGTGRMSVQLLKLRGVPDEEADEVRALLDRHGIDYYETPAGRWGISMPALWLREDDQLSCARALIGQYHTDRFKRAREDYARRSSEGQIPTLGEAIRHDPVRCVLYVAIIALVLYLSIMPFLNLGSW